MGNVMGCCQTKLAKGGNGKLKMDGVDDDAEPEVRARPPTLIHPCGLKRDGKIGAANSQGIQNNYFVLSVVLFPPKQVIDAPKKEITPENLLLSAALAGDASTVQTLLSSGISVNSKGDKDYTALHNATRNGHTALVEMLVSHKAEINAKTNAQVEPSDRHVEDESTARLA